jgi:hypothetical protein
MREEDNFVRNTAPNDPEKNLKEDEIESTSDSKSHIYLWAIICLFFIIGGVGVLTTMVKVKNTNATMDEVMEMFAFRDLTSRESFESMEQRIRKLED